MTSLLIRNARLLITMDDARRIIPDGALFVRDNVIEWVGPTNNLSPELLSANRIIDATDQVLGQVAVEAARLLRGKHKPTYTPHIDTGDNVIVINAEKVRLTGTKEESKIYTSFSGYVGGQKVETPKKIRARRPELLVERAVRGMIPHNRLGRAQFKKLHVYNGAEHQHEAQKPEPYSL